MAPIPAAKFIAPAATIAATWVVGKSLNAGYRRITGNEPPNAADREVPLRQAVLWALATATALALVNLAIERWVSPDGIVAELDSPPTA